MAEVKAKVKQKQKFKAVKLSLTPEEGHALKWLLGRVTHEDMRRDYLLSPEHASMMKDLYRDLTGCEELTKVSEKIMDTW